MPHGDAMRYASATPAQRAGMLRAIGVPAVESGTGSGAAGEAAGAPPGAPPA